MKIAFGSMTGEIQIFILVSRLTYWLLLTNPASERMFLGSLHRYCARFIINSTQQDQLGIVAYGYN